MSDVAGGADLALEFERTAALARGLLSEDPLPPDALVVLLREFVAWYEGQVRLTAREFLALQDKLEAVAEAIAMEPVQGDRVS